MRGAGGVHAVCATLLMSSCAAQPPLRSADQVMMLPLSPRLERSTLHHLLAYAAKDRVCRASMPRSSRADGPTVLHSDPWIHYRSCIYRSSLTVCDATSDDWRTLRLLMERDPRLPRVADFASLTRDVANRCGPASAQASHQVLRQSSAPAPRKCTRGQAILIGAAIRLRWPQYDDKFDPRYADWLRDCNSVLGLSFFDSDHCPRMQRRNRLLGSSRAPEHTDAVELGVEAYFCPDVDAATIQNPEASKP